MKIAFYGDSLTEGIPGASYFKLLQQRFPQDVLLNFGQGDDTAYSLRRRIVRQHLLRQTDLAFVWIGTNDIPFKVSPVVDAAKRLRGKPWAATPEQFREHYRALLDLLAPPTAHLIAVSPLIIGEDPTNRYNRYLQGLDVIVREVAAQFANTRYLDLRSLVLLALEKEPRSRYLPGNVFRTLLDALVARSDAQIDHLAARRSLCLTIDGVHLNNAGASLVADEFAKIIAAT